jgi:pyridoxamine 5'-phosphate oxidase
VSRTGPDATQAYSVDLAALRREYESTGIDDADLPDEPVALWRRWLDDAQDAAVAEINAMVVSTVDAEGVPSSRTVLCKGADESGFVFYTNYGSRKGRALDETGRASLLFPWHPLSRQVIVEGSVERTSRQESEEYFATRPRGSQLGAWASRQSETVVNRGQLEAQAAEADRNFAGEDVPCPPFWGGYRVRPTSVEFWQGRRDRLHDRLRYRATASRWVVERLSP